MSISALNNVTAVAAVNTYDKTTDKTTKESTKAAEAKIINRILKNIQWCCI